MEPTLQDTMKAAEQETKGAKAHKSVKVKKSRSKPGSEWKTLQIELLAVDSLTMNDTQLAEKYHVNRATIYRHKETIAFKEALLAAKKEAYNSAMGKLQGYTDKALDYLGETIADYGTQDRIKVTVAKLLLETAVKVHQQDDLEQRVADLEAKAGV